MLFETKKFSVAIILLVATLLPNFALSGSKPGAGVANYQATDFRLPSLQGIRLNQRSYSDTNLYISEAWALQKDSELTEFSHYQLTCLSTVYAMIEKARGNTSYRVGASGTWDSAGAVKISGTGPSRTTQTDAVQLLSQLMFGNPVILRGKSPAFDPLEQHFVLAIGIDKNGDILALDPYGGKEITIDSKTWISKNSEAGTFEVVDMRLVSL